MVSEGLEQGEAHVEWGRVGRVECEEALILRLVWGRKGRARLAEGVRCWCGRRGRRRVVGGEAGYGP